MTNQQILEKAIQKAIDGGWFKTEGFNGYTVWCPVSALDTLVILEEKESHEKRQYNYQAIIFNHDFAKALWGEEEIGLDQYGWNNVAYFTQFDTPINYIIKLSLWQYHLQQMVISEDPIKYLGANI